MTFKLSLNALPVPSPKVTKIKTFKHNMIAKGGWIYYTRVSELTRGRRKRQNMRICDKEGIVLREPEHV